MAGPLKRVARLQLGATQVEVWTDVKSLKKQVGSFGKVGVGRANSRALNKAAGKTKTFTGRLLSTDYNLKIRAIQSRLKISPKSSVRNETVGILGHGPRLGVLHNSKTKPKPGPLGVRFNMGGGNKVHAHTFIAKMQSGHTGIFLRATLKRTRTDTRISPTTGKRYQTHLPIREITYPSAAFMITNTERAEKIFKFFVDDYPVQLHRQLDFELQKSKGLV